MIFLNFLTNNKHNILESFDTSFNIDKVQKGNPSFYYVKINKHQFRIFVEESELDSLDLHIGFEYFDGKEYTIEGLHKILDTKEILGLFGTILKILKKLDFKSLLICSSDSKKIRTYIRMVQKLAKEFSITDIKHDDTCIIAFIKEYPKYKFKYKK